MEMMTTVMMKMIMIIAWRWRWRWWCDEAVSCWPAVPAFGCALGLVWLYCPSLQLASHSPSFSPPRDGWACWSPAGPDQILQLPDQDLVPWVPVQVLQGFQPSAQWTPLASGTVLSHTPPDLSRTSAILHWGSQPKVGAWQARRCHFARLWQLTNNLLNIMYSELDAKC